MLTTHTPACFALLIDIELGKENRHEIARRFETYRQQLAALFQPHSGFLGAELHELDEHRLQGRLNWRHQRDWETAWDCQQTRNDLFADSLLRLGARSIRFDSELRAPMV